MHRGGDATSVLGINFRNTSKGIMPIHIVNGRLCVFHKMHIGIIVIAVVFVCSVIVDIGNCQTLDKFQVHAVRNPFVTDVVKPEIRNFIAIVTGNF